jgi:hypothetical protein
MPLAVCYEAEASGIQTRELDFLCFSADKLMAIDHMLEYAVGQGDGIKSCGGHWEMQWLLPPTLLLQYIIKRLSSLTAHHLHFLLPTTGRTASMLCAEATRDSACKFCDICAVVRRQKEALRQEHECSTLSSWK